MRGVGKWFFFLISANFTASGAVVSELWWWFPFDMKNWIWCVEMMNLCCWICLSFPMQIMLGLAIKPNILLSTPLFCLATYLLNPTTFLYILGLFCWAQILYFWILHSMFKFCTSFLGLVCDLRIIRFFRNFEFLLVIEF